MAFTARYYGSIAEFHNDIACGADDPDHPGRYILRFWDAGNHQVLRNVRRESFEASGVTVYPGAVCRCGQNHDRWTP